MKRPLLAGMCVVLALGIRSVQVGECSPDPCEAVICDPCGPNFFVGVNRFGKWTDMAFGHREQFSGGVSAVVKF